jgi:hypothetical protein
MKLVKVFDEIKDKDSISFLLEMSNNVNLTWWDVISDDEIDEEFDPVYENNKYENEMFKKINHELIKLGANVDEFVIIKIY